MADDIDDLLDEVEDSLSRDVLRSTSTTPSTKSVYSTLRVKNSQSESVKTDDLKDLLDDLEDSPFPPRLPSRAGLEDPPLPPRLPSRAGGGVAPGGSKCSSPCLAGTAVPAGIPTGVTLRACDCLRCLKCDMAVVTVDGFCWSRATDYLFLRNNYPDLSRLRARLEPRRGARAYACQCQHCSFTEPTTVAQDGTVKWVCGGHPPRNV
ncbi:Protein C8orf37 [Chionoecetes opilio]|uniref:Cilia- and flagella-associated protein 418 n=1 Tax=Chionoecetes opilio TaxID=41210 RepID=A0A8J5CAB6_CHIOP|nr:Protein C8orf37 [Chionoecetes opilio]